MDMPKDFFYALYADSNCTFTKKNIQVKTFSCKLKMSLKMNAEVCVVSRPMFK